jgi:dTDP-4-amino-4,6-dideoxygalactose transaminase
MTSSAKIPFVDLVTAHRELETELLSVFRTALDTAGFVGGPAVQQFECEFAAFCAAAHCVGVNSGTDALRFALMAVGVQPGDVVLTVPHTFIATTEAISQAGAQPALVDIDADTYTMDPEKLRRYLETECFFDRGGRRTIHKNSRKLVSAIVPVHLYGQIADMDPILDLAARYNLAVVEDACQAHGAAYYSRKHQQWRKAGSMGRAAAFSFYPGKNLGACGEAGAVTTQDEAVAARVRMLRDHGQSTKYYHDIEGYNGRLDSIQAGILSVKLQHLSRWNEQRRESACVYNELLYRLAGSVTPPSTPPWSKHVYHLYVIRTAFRDKLQEHLTRAGVGTGIHYPIPVHLQKAYASFGWKRGEFPVSEKAASQVLSLPMYAGLRAEQQRCVVESIEQCADTFQTRSAVRLSC